MKQVMKLFILLPVLMAWPVFARDGWLGRPHVCDMPSGSRSEICQAWISTVKRPDYRASSCCGDGDAFIADDFEVIGDNLFAIISIDYPDAPAGYSEDADGTPIEGVPIIGLKRGTRILIPPEKRNIDQEDANRSGHGVVFLFPGTTTVLCYFAPPLT